MIKILIADDQELIRDSLRIVLAGNPDFSVDTAKKRYRGGQGCQAG